ncbi:uncharacterized protein LOC18438233 [Amborella trichopoda]|nr:uncharacterized protein LOC18438233 [Amborella trichopoda]|eukprot:XP_006848485.2 uncharacterized protein LOC18438233 [Amborella trichopoda]
MMMARDFGTEEMEREDGVELSLGLSIGGSFRRSQEKVGFNGACNSDLKITETKERESVVHGGERETGVIPNGFSVFNAFENREGGSELMEQQRKREMHALRRQEARKKREEKQQKKGFPKVSNGVSLEDRSTLEAQELACRVKDRQVRERELGRSERKSVLQKEEEEEGRERKCGSEKQNLTLNINQQENNPCGYAPPAGFPVYPFQFIPNSHHHHVQYLPFANGFSFPYVMPCWTPVAPGSGNPNHNPNSQDGGSSNGSGTVFQPIPCRSIPHPNPNSSSEESKKSGKDGVKQELSSIASQGSGSAISDYESGSPQGGSSSDMRSNSSHSHSDRGPNIRSLSNQIPANGSSHPSAISEPSTSSHKVAEEAPDKSSAHSSPGKAQSLKPEPDLGSITQPQIPESKPIEPISSSAQGTLKTRPEPNLGLVIQTKQCERINGQEKKVALPHMPCVSATGDGPDGKTINGFLYRYTKGEISIVCVCHGSFLSPAEFVRHAGVTDVSQPLKHIIMAPTTFG